MKILSNYTYDCLLGYKDNFNTIAEKLARVNKELDDAKDSLCIEKTQHGLTITDLKLIQGELDKANNTITEILLTAAVNGLDIKLVPEKVIPSSAKITPAKFTPAHISVKKVVAFCMSLP